MIGATEPSSPTAWPVSVRYPGSSFCWGGSCRGGRTVPPQKMLTWSDRCRSYGLSPSAIIFTVRRKRWFTCPGQDKANPGYPTAWLLTELGGGQARGIAITLHDYSAISAVL